MKNVSVNLTDKQEEVINELLRLEHFNSRSELIRFALFNMMLEMNILNDVDCIVKKVGRNKYRLGNIFYKFILDDDGNAFKVPIKESDKCEV